MVTLTYSYTSYIVYPACRDVVVCAYAIIYIHWCIHAFVKTFCESDFSSDASIIGRSACIDKRTKKKEKSMPRLFPIFCARHSPFDIWIIFSFSKHTEIRCSRRRGFICVGDQSLIKIIARDRRRYFALSPSGHRAIALELCDAILMRERRLRWREKNILPDTITNFTPFDALSLSTCITNRSYVSNDFSATHNSRLNGSRGAITLVTSGREGDADDTSDACPPFPFVIYRDKNIVCKCEREKKVIINMLRPRL